MRVKRVGTPNSCRWDPHQSSGDLFKEWFFDELGTDKKNARKNISDMRVLLSLHLLSGLGSFSMSFQHAVTRLLFAPGTCPGSTCSVGGGPTDNQEVADSRASCVEVCKTGSLGPGYFPVL